MAEGWGAMLHTQSSTRSTSGGSDKSTATRVGLRCLGRARSGKDESGAAAVEFALILIPFLVLVFGLIQYGLYFYSAQSGSHVASRAARQLSVGNCQDLTELKDYVFDQLGSATNAGSTSNPDFNVTVEDTTGTTMVPFANTDVGETLVLELEFPTINMHFPFVPFLSDSSISRTIEARVEDTSDEGCPS